MTARKQAANWRKPGASEWAISKILERCPMMWPQRKPKSKACRQISAPKKGSSFAESELRRWLSNGHAAELKGKRNAEAEAILAPFVVSSGGKKRLVADARRKNQH